MKEFERLKDDDRWVGPAFRFTPGVETRQASVWRQAGFALVGGLAVAAILLGGVALVRSTTLHTSSEVLDPGFRQTAGAPDDHLTWPGAPRELPEWLGQTEPFGIFSDDFSAIEIVLYGSSNCPLVPVKLETDAAASVIVTFNDPGLGDCTPDLAPTTTSFPVPDGLAVGVIPVKLMLPNATYLVTVSGDRVVTPGMISTIAFSAPVTQEFTGSHDVDLGERPPGANGVMYAVSCLTSGALEFGDGAGSLGCPNGAGASTTSSAPKMLHDGENTFAVTTDPDTEWRISTYYVESHLTDWAVNANGETYGVRNDNGTPDLVSASATNRRTGYIRHDDQQKLLDACGSVTSDDACVAAYIDEHPTIPVYLSDGETVIGEFEIGPDASTAVFSNPE